MTSVTIGITIGGSTAAGISLITAFSTSGSFMIGMCTDDAVCVSVLSISYVPSNMLSHSSFGELIAIIGICALCFSAAIVVMSATDFLRKVSILNPLFVIGISTAVSASCFFISFTEVTSGATDISTAEVTILGCEICLGAICSSIFCSGCKASETTARPMNETTVLSAEFASAKLGTRCAIFS